AMVLVAVFPDIRHAIYNRMAAVLTPVGGTLAEPLLSFQSLPRYGVWPGRIAPLAAIRARVAPMRSLTIAPIWARISSLIRR
ncbi:hypothetical protein, partial [Escherichia coli]|uniref:hypothetical protein n=1 Tax=Escherichia coli TaxID=562 RepID=UPI0015C45A48|nr:hypothetical protein [Escherichia coli]